MNICVFSSSSNALYEIYFEAARQLGKLIGTGGHQLIYGGTNVGLMEETAKAVRLTGAKTVGVIPRRIHDKELSSDENEEQIITDNMRDRKYFMRKRSDAFIALPGGFGTLEEILEVITLKQLHYHNKPVVLVNVNGFFDSLLQQFERSFEETFAHEEYRKLYFIADSAADAMKYIESYKPELLTTKWYNVPRGK